MTHSLASLLQSNCVPMKGQSALASAEVGECFSLLPHWRLSDDRKSILREFRFEDFHRTMAFVNALAWVAHREDHHPDAEFGYNYCRLRFNTHDVDGLSLNDFICAAKVDALIQ